VEVWGGWRGGVLVEHVGDHFDFGFCCGDFLGGGGLGAGAAAEEEGHSGWALVGMGGGVGECAYGKQDALMCPAYWSRC